MNIKTIVHLLSGGLDSVTMLHDLKQQGHSVYCVLFDYKQRHSQELTFAKHHCHRLRVLFRTLEIPALAGLTEDNWIVPNRNAVMLSLAVNVAIQVGADTVTIGCNAGDAQNFPDCRSEFIEAMNKAVQSAGYKVEICAPYLDRSKAWIARMASDLRIRSDEIWTCYKGGSKPCGECPACKKLSEAMA